LIAFVHTPNNTYKQTLLLYHLTLLLLERDEFVL